MLRLCPKLSYAGLTVILSNPSRFDTLNLLSSTGGHLFNNFCLRPEFNSMQCDIRVSEDKSPFLPNTKCIMLLGERALYDWIPESRNNALNEVRGSVFKINSIPAIPSFYPQDAADVKGHEQALNKLDAKYAPDDDDYEKEDSEDYDSVKRLGRTKRSNYGFWLRADTRKAKQILSGNGFATEKKPVYKTHVSSEEIIQQLTRSKGGFLYLDIETDYELNIQCFSFTFDGAVIYNVPVLDHNYAPASGQLPYIFRALAIAIRDNTTVAHNGACFDFFVLAIKYGIAVRRCYDTMIAQHRCFPDIEKSLGHCVSLWTWEKFHKDEDSEGYMTREQMYKRMAYCGKDVYTMYLIHQEITKYAKTIPGLTDSINTAQSHIVPYLITTIQGIQYDMVKLVALQKENDRLMMQYIRVINILIGEGGLAEIKKEVKGKAKSFAGSNTQCVEYFHNILGYPVVYRSPKTGKPGLGKKNMYKLALKHNNPVITFVLLYRTVAKEYSTLKFLPWRDDNNKIIDHKTYNPLAALMTATTIPTLDTSSCKKTIELVVQ